MVSRGYTSDLLRSNKAHVKLQKSASSSSCNFREIRCHCFRPCTHFYFSLPKEKFLRGQGEKNTWAKKGNYKSICRKWECHQKRV